MIERLQSGANDAVNVMEESHIKARKSVDRASNTGQALQKITSSVNTIKQMHLEISNAAGQQTNVAHESVSYSAEASQESENLNQLASHLQELMQQFKV